MPDYSKRSDELEIMDDLACEGPVVAQTLREIEFINRTLGGNGVTLNALGKLIPAPTAGPVSVVDLGCGGGDMLRRIRRWSGGNHSRLDLTGIDANPFIVKFATDRTGPDTRVSFECVNIFSEEFKSRTFDIAMGTLFFHHFTNEQLIEFLRQLKGQLRIGLVINDIHRHWAAYHLIRLLTRLFSRSAMVRFDAPMSVLRAFRREDLRYILENAGFSDYTIRWMWAFRWQVVARVGEKMA